MKQVFEIRKSHDRGHTDTDWFESYHTFSFDQYYDAEHMGFGPIKVINEDTIAPGMGFGSHPHRDMEILTYVISGQLEHKDSLGSGAIIESGDILKMSAGQGIIHSSYNASSNEPVHLLQIWITPKSKGLAPSFEQESVAFEHNKFILLGGPDFEKDAPIHINQNLRLFRLQASTGHINRFKAKPGSSIWVQMVQGNCSINGLPAEAGDGVALDKEEVEICPLSSVELLLFEMPSKKLMH